VQPAPAATTLAVQGATGRVARCEDHAGGGLTKFRERLEGEVNAQTGERFHIFQDRDMGRSMGGADQ